MTPPDSEIPQWVAQARDGSSEALGRALEGCRNYLLLVARNQLDPQLRAKGGASDLVQETFLDAQRDFARFQGVDEADLLAWVRQILLNNAATFARRYRTGKRDLGREVALGSDDSENLGPVPPDRMLTPGSEAMEREQADALHRTLATLPDDYRRVIALRYLDGHSFEEIGRRMDRSADAARKLWARAMDRLRQEWDVLYDSEPR